METRRFLRSCALGLAAAAMLAGVALAFYAWQHGSASTAVTALLLVLASPTLAVAAAFMHRQRHADERTPADVHLETVEAADTALRVVRLARAHLCTIASFGIVLWICQAGRLVEVRSFLYWYTLIITVAMAACLPWLARQERCALEWRNAGRQLLREARSAEGWFVR